MIVSQKSSSRAGRRVSAIAAAVTVAVTLVAAPATAATLNPAGTDWLGTVNAYRATAGLPPVTANAAWSDGALKHSKYAVLNGVIGHSEDPTKPGYTVEGDLAARSSNVANMWGGTGDARRFIDMWMEGPFHAAGILDPRLSASGYGQYTEGSSTAATLDVIRGVSYVTPFDQPVVWPGHGSTVPLDAYTGGEWPDPLAGCAGYTVPSGLPLVIQLGSNPAASVSKVTLTVGGAPVEHCTFDKARYTNPDAGTQAYGRQVLASRGTVVIVPRKPLTRGVAYTLVAETTGGRLTSTFKVGAPRTSFVSGTRPTPGFAPVAKPTATARDIADTCDGNQTTSFSDIRGNAHEYAIRCVASAGIAQGRGDGAFDPAGTLSKGQTATFLTRTLLAGGGALPITLPEICGGTAGTHETALEQLIAMNIADYRDCGAANAAITRATMADWVAKSLQRNGVSGPTTLTDWYYDDEGSVAATSINLITSLGIVTGKGDGTYGPSESLTRAQMATFLARTLDALAE